MALVVNDRVKETSTTTGTGTFTLDGAVTGFETFSSAIGNTNTTYYAIVNTSDGAFEVGLGTVGAGTLARTTIISSSNSDSAVDFAAGTKNVFVTLPASKSVILDSSGNIVANNGSNLTNLDADNLASGTVPDARFPATLPAANGSALTDLEATNIATGLVPTARLGTGTASSTTFLAGDQTYKTITADITAVTAGDGLTGGGSSGDVTLNVGAGNLIDVQADQIDVDLSELTTSTSDADGDFFAVVDAANAQKKLTKANINISGFNNDSGFIDGSSLNASNLDSGTVPDARFPATLPALNGSALTNLDAANLATNLVPTARLGTGTASSTTFLAGDQTYKTITADITGVTAGSGLTGGGTTGDVTLNVGAGALIDVTADAIDVDLSELTTSTSDADGDFFVVVDASNNQKKLTKANINNSGFNNDAGYTTNVGDITGVTAGTNLTGGGTSGTVTINMDTGGIGAGTYGSTANATKIDTITVDAYGRVTAVATGATGDGDITGVTAGTLLDGGGTSGTVTLNVDLSELSTSTTNGDGDYFVVVDTANAQRKLTKGNIAISGFNNDSGFTTNTGTVTSVTGGNGLTGSVTTSGSLAVGAGTGIDVAADSISVDVSDFMSNGSNNRILTATGTDGMNAETNLNFDGSSLNINGNINDVTDIYLEDQIFHAGDTDTYMQFHAANQWRVVTGGTEMLECNDSDVKITNGNLIPSAGETQDLGSAGSPWRNIYTGDLHLSNKGHSEGNSIDGTKGDWTIQEGAEDLYILNNKSGKRYKFKLEEM